jgi:hypothetical protein
MPRIILLALIFWASCFGADPIFRATFDQSLDASIAKGDPKLYSSSSYRRGGEPGLGGAPEGIAAHAPKEGRNGGGALKFLKKNTAAVFFKAQNNVPMNSGTISFWLKLDPEQDLAPDYCDPLQVTDKAYNDSAIWVDFTKDEKPRHFRLGVFGMLVSWNPTDLPPDKNPAFNNRLVVVKKPPFSREEWTHIVITYKDLGKGAGWARLYLNGKIQGVTSQVTEPFAWAPNAATIRLGVNYTGLLDDLEVYAQPLNARQVANLK